MSKFDGLDKKGSPITLETDSHGPIRKTLIKLSELGYIQNYEERQIGTKRLIIEKLAFANGDIKKKIDMYNMKFQRTEKAIDFEDETLRRAFPGVFGQRGLIARQGYNITRDENGTLQIEYPKKKDRKLVEVTKSAKEETLKDRVKVDISQKEQSEFTKSFLEKQEKEHHSKKDIDLSK